MENSRFIENKCCVRGCQNTGMQARMHRFPKNPGRCEEWLKALGNSYNDKGLPVPITRMWRRFVCAKHFQSSCYTEHNLLKRTATPTIHLDHQFNISAAATTSTKSSSTENTPSVSGPAETTSTLSSSMATASTSFVTDHHFNISAAATMSTSTENTATPRISGPTETTSTLSASTSMVTASTSFVTDHQFNISAAGTTSTFTMSTSTEKTATPSISDLAETTSTPSASVATASMSLVAENLPSTSATDTPGRLLRVKETRKALIIGGRRYPRVYRTNKKKILKYGFRKKIGEVCKNLNENAKEFVQMMLRNSARKKKGHEYTMKEKLLCLALYKYSPKGYKFLQKTLQLVPSITTLRSMVRNIHFGVGLKNNSVLNFLKEEAVAWNVRRRYCSIVFDEVALTPGMSISMGEDRMVGFVDLDENERRKRFADHALVFMLRGVCESWKQVIAYYFSEGTTPANRLKDILKEVVTAVKGCNLIPVCLICDQGSTNRGAINNLRIETMRECNLNGVPYEENVLHLCDEKLFVIYDPPHLLKGMRNGMMKYDVKYGTDGTKRARWKDIVEAYERDSVNGEMRCLPKITDAHVLSSKMNKMKVRNCVQIFSSSMTKYLNTLKDFGRRKMFALCRQTHPATGVEHAVSCCFYNAEDVCLVTAGANIMKVFRLVPEGSSREFNAAGQPVPPKMKLECLANYTLWGCVMSLQAVRSPGGGRDLLLVSFREAKLSVLQYEPATDNLVTLSMHYFEEDDMKGGWTTHPHIPWVRVDPEHRCVVMLLYGRKLAVLPLRRDVNAEDADTADTKPLDVKAPSTSTTTVNRSPVLASYVIVLKDLDEKIDNIIDLQFLHGYYEPTLLLLYEPVRTFAGRTAVRNDTCAMVGVSLNVQQRVHPIIWSTGGLPFDCTQAVAIHKPLGGCLIVAVNSLIYLNQSVPPYGVSLNSIATHTTNFPLRIQEGVSVTMDAACVATIGEGRLALSLKGGQLYVLTLLSDSVRSVRSFHLDRAAASVLTTCMCVVEEDFLFLGSRLGNSLLLRVTERENRMLLSLDRPLENTIDLTEPEAEQQSAEAAAKKRRLDTLSDCVATNVIEISDKDELEVYGSDIRTSTQLTSYVFEVCDSLLNIGPIGDVSMGEPQLLSEEYSQSSGPLVELVCTSGHAKNGALTVLQRSIRPQLLTTFNLPGCIDMWTVIGEPSEPTAGAKEPPDSEGLHAYMLLTQDETTMVLQTGQEINEVDSSGFMTHAPTVFAGNLGNNRYMVQVTTAAIRLVKNGQQIQHITLEWTAASASAADPYVCVASTCGRALVLALREARGASARLAPTRQPVPHRPPLVRACAYRDLSGLFTEDLEAAQVKGEFAGKMKAKAAKKMKAEGFLPDTVYELNDEDELLYGGDQTPASMASIMIAELSSGERAGVPRRVSRWWNKHLVEHKPTYWLLVVRDNGNLEIYSLPEMRLSFLVRDIVGGARILADSLESVSMLMGLGSSEELTSQAAGQTSSVDINLLKEVMMVGLGNKGSRPLLLIRMQHELMVYQVYKYPKGHLKMRFSRVPVTWPFGYTGEASAPDNENYEAWLLKDNVRQMRYFGNIGGYNGVLVCGVTPYFLVLSPRGEVRAHPLAPEDGPVPTAAPFNNPNCPQGFLYFNNNSEMRICALATHLSYDAPWPVRKVPLRMTPHFVTFHLESKTYCLVASIAQPSTSYYRFNGEDKELTTENKGDRFPYPMQERFSVMLFSPVSWEIIPNTKMELEEWEHVTCFKNVSLSYEGTRSGLRGYIALGTNYNYGEDITSRGRIIIYDIIDVVPEPGQPLTKNRFKEVYAKEQKGPVTALAQVLGFLISAVGQKIYIWQLKDDDLVGVAFIDTQIYVHRMLSVNNLILIADVYKSVSLLRYQEQHRTLSLVSRDMRSTQVYETEFMVDNTNLGFLVSERDGNFVQFHYQPQARESFGGQRLLRKADYHLGQQVHTMFRIACRAAGGTREAPVPYRRHATMFATLDGGLGYMLPVSEKTYRRLLMLQNVMNNYCCHIAGLNPKAFRTYTGGAGARRGGGGGGGSSGPARGVLDGDLVYSYLHLPHSDREDIAKKIGTKVEEIFADLYEIDKQTAHF